MLLKFNVIAFNVVVFLVLAIFYFLMVIFINKFFDLEEKLSLVLIFHILLVSVAQLAVLFVFLEAPFFWPDIMKKVGCIAIAAIGSFIIYIVIRKRIRIAYFRRERLRFIRIQNGGSEYDKT